MKPIPVILMLAIFFCAYAFIAGAAGPVVKDDADKLNYSLGTDLGQRVLAKGLAFEPNLLWQALYEGKAGVEAAAEASENYLLGYRLGEEIAAHQIEFRGEALWQGLYDAIDNAPLRLRAIEIKQLLRGLRGGPKVGKPEAGIAQKNRDKSAAEPPPKVYRLPGQKFLAENLEKEGVVSLPSGLQYRVLSAGEGRTPKVTDTVLINYQGRSIEGQVFSGTFQQGIPTPKEVVVDKVIPGMSEALMMMREGDHWEIYIPTRLAFKDTGPMAGQTVIYDLELVEILAPLLSPSQQQ